MPVNVWLVVVMVSVAIWECVPSSATELGETEQDEFVGFPVQVRFTLCLNPCSGVIVIVDIPEFPRPQSTRWETL